MQRSDIGTFPFKTSPSPLLKVNRRYGEIGQTIPAARVCLVMCQSTLTFCNIIEATFEYPFRCFPLRKAVEQQQDGTGLRFLFRFSLELHCLSSLNLVSRFIELVGSKSRFGNVDQ